MCCVRRTSGSLWDVGVSKIISQSSVWYSWLVISVSAALTFDEIPPFKTGWIICISCLKASVREYRSLNNAWRLYLLRRKWKLPWHQLFSEQKVIVKGGSCGCRIKVSGTSSSISKVHQERKKCEEVKSHATLVGYRIKLLMDQHISAWGLHQGHHSHHDDVQIIFIDSYLNRSSEMKLMDHPEINLHRTKMTVIIMISHLDVFTFEFLKELHKIIQHVTWWLLEVWICFQSKLTGFMFILSINSGQESERQEDLTFKDPFFFTAGL